MTDLEKSLLEMLDRTLVPLRSENPVFREDFAKIVEDFVETIRKHDKTPAPTPTTPPLPPEIVELLRDVASGPCMPDLRGRAGAALVRRDLVSCQRCGGSGYERIGDGSVNAWGACEICRPAVEYRPPTTFVDSGTGQAVTVEHPQRAVTFSVPAAPSPEAKPPAPTKPCDDHRPDGPSPVPNCGCAEVDRLFSGAEAKPPATTREPADPTRGPMTWGVSADEESFHGHYASKEEALANVAAEIEELEPGQRFWVGGGRLWRPSFSVDADALFDRLADHAGDECGEIAEDWLSAVAKADSDALEEALHSTVLAWLTRTGHMPQFYCCETVEEHHAPAAPAPADPATSEEE